MIRRLNQGLGIPADILIEDVETDSTVVDQEPEMDFTRFPLKEMLERGCFGDFEGNAQRLKEYAEDLVRKFMQDLLPKQVSPAFLRAPMHQRGDRQADEMALLAWRRCPAASTNIKHCQRVQARNHHANLAARACQALDI